jgi:ABC-type branched-subunit amino acid transport system ATPase component
MKGIEKHFGSVIALAGVSVDIYPGECHCLLGDNGAGKSTFIKTMSGVHKPTKAKSSLKAADAFRRSAGCDLGRYRDGVSGSGDDPADVCQPELLHGQRARSAASVR